MRQYRGDSIFFIFNKKNKNKKMRQYRGDVAVHALEKANVLVVFRVMLTRTQF